MNRVPKVPYLGAVIVLALATSTGAAYAQADEADVVLDVPNLSVDELHLTVEKLDLTINLDARLASLLTLKAGVDASADKVALDVTGVQAELHLRARLDEVTKIIDRTLTTVDNNPQILEGLLSGVGNLLSQTTNALGQTVLRTVDQTGRILERTLDSSGNILGQQVVGSVLNLPVLSETTNAAGQTVRRVQAQSGAIIEVVLDAAGNVLSTRVVSQAVGGAS